MTTQTTFMWPRRFHRSHSVGKRFPKIQKGVASLVSSYLEIEFHWPYPPTQALYPMVEGENGQRRWFLPVLPKWVLQGIGPDWGGRSGTVDVWVISNWWIHHFLDQLVRAKWELACPVPASSLVNRLTKLSVPWAGTRTCWLLHCLGAAEWSPGSGLRSLEIGQTPCMICMEQVTIPWAKKHLRSENSRSIESTVWS